MQACDDIIERARELAVLRDAVDDLFAGTGALVVLEGPAGIGKSRLIKEVIHEFREARGRVLSARGAEMERAFPLGVVRQLFEALVSAQTPQRQEEWLAGAAGPAADLIGPARPGGQDPLTGDFANLHGLYWLTANISQDQPLMLVVDDAHWADVGSLRFLTYLAQHAKDLPVLLVLAFRPGEAAADGDLVQQLTSYPGGNLIVPQPLSLDGAREMIQRRLGAEAEAAFVDACHTAAGGNPLLLETLTEPEGIEPIAANADLILQTGALAVAHRVSVRLAQLPRQAAALAQAVAVWGQHASVSDVAELAGISKDSALEAVSSLQRIDMLRPGDDVMLAHDQLEFVHPLLRSAVYNSMNWAKRIAWHRRAAELLAERGAPATEVGSHLLRIPPSGDADIVNSLREAAAEARRSGFSESAYVFLQRALAEPPGAGVRAEVLTEAGAAAHMVDLEACATHLADALALTSDVYQRAGLACVLGNVLLLLSCTSEAVTVMSQARDALPVDDVDLRRHLEACLLLTPMMVPGWLSLTERLPDLLTLTPADTLGDRALAAAIAGILVYAGDPATVTYARSALADGTLNQASAIGAWYGLLAADQIDEAMDALDNEVKRTRHTGSLPHLAIALMYRGLGWMWQGQLAEAEQHLTEALTLMETTHHVAGVPLAESMLTRVWLEQGRIAEAEACVDLDGPTPPLGMQQWNLENKGCVLRARGLHERALESALAAGERFLAHGGQNPALVNWRSDAALDLWALDRKEEALAYAHQELDLARRWGAPRALGLALRVAGMVTGGLEGLDLLRESVEVLRPSPARLELAKSLIQYGAALRRAGQRGDARELLTEGQDLAQRCGASGLESQAAVELNAVGGNPRRERVLGPEALTPSERRVAQLACQGKNNRDIAQALFVTTKTVEAHLTNTYRKLQVTSRLQLVRAMSEAERLK